MADAIAVLNAGSSSLKFSLFAGATAELELDRARPGRGPLHRAALRREGSARARSSARSPGATASSSATTARSITWSPSCAPSSASTASSASAIASCTAGSSTRAPVRVDATVLRGAGEVRSARAAAPAAQPGADPGAARALARAAAGGVLRHRVPPRPAAGGAGVRAAQGDHRRAACGATASTGSRTSTSPTCCRSSTQARRAAGPWCCISATAPACARSQAGSSVASTMGFTAVDGLPMGTRCGNLDPGRDPLPDGRAEDGRARHREADLPAVGPARRVGHLQRHAHAARRATSRDAKAGDRPLRLPHRPRAGLARRGARRARRDRVHRRHRREQPRACASASAAMRRGSASSSIAAANERRRPAHQHRRRAASPPG